MDHYEHVMDSDNCTMALDTPGFPRLLWDLLRSLGGSRPPRYVAREYTKHSFPRCWATVTVLANDAEDWQPFTVKAKGTVCGFTIEAVTLKALAEAEEQSDDQC